MSTIDSDYAQGLWKKQWFINLNGTMAKLLHMQGYYNNIGIYVTDDNYIVTAYAKTSTSANMRAMKARGFSVERPRFLHKIQRRGTFGMGGAR